MRTKCFSISLPIQATPTSLLQGWRHPIAVVGLLCLIVWLWLEKRLIPNWSPAEIIMWDNNDLGLDHSQGASVDSADLLLVCFVNLEKSEDHVPVIDGNVDSLFSVNKYCSWNQPIKLTFLWFCWYFGHQNGPKLFNVLFYKTKSSITPLFLSVPVNL